MQDLSSWAEHLKEPLVLVGFVIMLLAGIITTLLKKDIFRLSQAASERLIKKILLYGFVLGIMVVVLSFGMALRKDTEESKSTIIQETKGGQSPSIVTKGKDSSVNITYGGPSKEEGDQSKARGNDEEKEEATAQSSRHIEQKTKGAQSPAVVSGGDVTINFESEKP